MDVDVGELPEPIQRFTTEKIEKDLVPQLWPFTSYKYL